MVVPPVHAWAAVPSPQLTVRVILFTGPSSVSAVWVMVPVRSTHETVNTPLGALRSATSCVIEAAGPERVLYGVTVSRTWVTPVRSTDADHAVTPTVLPARAAPVVAFVSATTYVVALVAAVQLALTVKLSAGLVSVMARLVTGPGFTGGLAWTGAASAETVRAVTVAAAASIANGRSSRVVTCFLPWNARGRPPWRPARVEDASGLAGQNPRNRTSGQYHPRPCLNDNAEHGLPYRSRM